jgi:Histidine kinase
VRTAPPLLACASPPRETAPLETLTASFAESARTDARRRAAILIIWASAFTLYVAAYTGAIRLSFGLSFAGSLVAGIANSLPDALAAPLILRATGGARVRNRSAFRLSLLGLAFVAWSVLGAMTGLAAIRAWEENSWHLSLDTRNVAWKALQSFLVFGVLAGVGRAQFHANEAREASARALRAETVRAESRLAILRAQLNPHFILNILHSLVGLAERDPQATADALEHLGTTLRYALRVQSRGSDRVALREELAFTREYLELERLRLGDRLETRFFVDEGALSCVVPPFVLQPLVENAVLHAIAPRSRGGVVSIRIARDGEALLLQVEDDGSSLDAGRNVDVTRSKGLGLRLLKDRIEALYGRNGTLAVDRSSLGGVRASLRLAGEPSAPEEGPE